MTETEAKTKWCPMARNDDPPGSNRGWHTTSPERPYLPRECLCIASACMMWRNPEPPESALHSLKGYCGLVGRP